MTTETAPGGQRAKEFIMKAIELLDHENKVLSFIKEQNPHETMEVCSIEISAKTKIILTLIQKN